MTTIGRGPTGAAFLDFANLHGGFHDALNGEQKYAEYQGRHPQLFSPKELMARLEARFGEVVLAKGYANWNFFVRYLDEVRNARVDTVFTNDRYDDDTDRVIVADAVEAACTATGLDFIVLASGDGGFTSLVQKLRRRRLNVFGVGVDGTIHPGLRAACDEYVTLTPDAEWPADFPKVSGSTYPRPAFPRTGTGNGALPPALASS